MPRIGLCVIASCLLLAQAARAHDDLHARLHDATLAIESAPEDGALRLARARLHHLHGDGPAALADLDGAAQLGADADAIVMLRAAVFMDTDRPHEALVLLDELLTRRPEHAGAHTRRGAALEMAGEPRVAAGAYRRALECTGARRPRHYVAWARALTAAGDTDGALAALERGITDLGPIIAFTEEAIAIERKAKRLDAAIARIDRVIRRARRPEKWLALRGDLLAESGRTNAARASRRAALAAIHRLPRSRRTTRAVLELETALLHHLANPGVPHASP